MKIKNLIKKYSFFLGFLIFAVIIFRLDWGDLIASLKKTNYLLAGLGLLLFIPITLVNTWRWNYLKKIQGLKYTLIDSFLIYNVGFLIGLITPGKVGMLTKIYYLKNNNCSTGKALVSVILEILFDIIYLLIFSYLGIIFTLKTIQMETNITYAFLALSLILLIVTYRAGWHKIIIKKIFYKLIPLKYQETWHTNFYDFLNELKNISIIKYFNVIIITTIIWLLYYYQVHILALSIGLKIPIIQLAVAVSVSILINLLPISLLGIGPREATLIILLKSFATDISSIVILSQLMLLANIAGGILGVISWKFRPLPLNKIMTPEKNLI